MDDIKFGQSVYYIQSYCLNPGKIFGRNYKYSKRIVNDKIINFDDEQVFLWVVNNFVKRDEVFVRIEDAEKRLFKLVGIGELNV